jgi:hypothetical protein
VENERKVRLWLRDRLGDRVLWIEHGAGGTVGLPDALVLLGGGRLMPVELKCDEMVGDQWAIKMRREQLAVARQIVGHGGCIGVLVGDKIGGGVWLMVLSRKTGVIRNGAKVYGRCITSGAGLLAVLRRWSTGKETSL